MYHLTLTRSERQAIDWVGYRYPHGDELYDILMECIPDDIEWSDSGNVTFDIPEYKAWEIQEVLGDSQFECFSEELASKLVQFMGSIV